MTSTTTEEAKLHLLSHDQRYGTKHTEMIDDYLHHWRSLVFENRIPSYLHYREMEERLWLELQLDGWDGNARTLNQIAGRIEKQCVNNP